MVFPYAVPRAYLSPISQCSDYSHGTRTDRRMDRRNWSSKTRPALCIKVQKAAKKQDSQHNYRYINSSTNYTKPIKRDEKIVFIKWRWKTSPRVLVCSIRVANRGCHDLRSSAITKHRTDRSGWGLWLCGDGTRQAGPGKTHGRRPAPGDNRHRSASRRRQQQRFDIIGQAETPPSRRKNVSPFAGVNSLPVWTSRSLCAVSVESATCLLIISSQLRRQVTLYTA